jgi:HD superfamily phosphohydrolase
MHSIGVAAIVWNFTNDIKQAAAGMLHDIATPVFAHTIDFMNNDHMTQESTEDRTRAVIENSGEIASLLRSHGILHKDVIDYHRYPIADNDTPMLSADRLEYTLGNGYIVYHMGLNQIKEIYDDLRVAENEHGALELCFRSADCAKGFVEISLRNSRFFVSDEDRFSMQCLSDMLRHAISIGALAYDDLYTTETEVIGKLGAHGELSAAWDKYAKTSTVFSSREEMKDRYCVNVSAKKRYIDPLVLVGGSAKRISAIDAGAKSAIESFLGLDFDKWLYTC